LPFYSEIVKNIKNLDRLLKAMNDPVFAEDDMTLKLRKIFGLVNDNFAKLETEYQNVLHPAKDKFSIDSADFLAPFDTMNSDVLIPILQSKLQLFIMQNKEKLSNVDVSYDSGTYTVKIACKKVPIKLKNEEITSFFVNSVLVNNNYTYQD